MNDIEKGALKAAARELKFAIGEAEQQQQQRQPPTFEEVEELYVRRALRIVKAYQATAADLYERE